MPKLGSAVRVLAIVTLTGSLATGLAGCGAATPRAETTRGPAPLDFAMLLPIETDSLLRVDLARIRRSPHHEAMLPVVSAMVAGAVSPALRPSLASILERTDEVLVALMPGTSAAQGEDVMVLARGRYERDELNRLDAGARALDPGWLERRSVDGHLMRIETDGEQTTAAALLRPDTMVATDQVERLERLIARTRMPARAPRWPPALRTLMRDAGLERTALGVVMADRAMGSPVGEPMAMSLVGTADVDDALELELLIELHDPGLAAAAAVLFSAVVHEVGQTTEPDAFALQQLARLARFETEGTRVRGTVRAEPPVADQLVPGLMGVLRVWILDE